MNLIRNGLLALLCSTSMNLLAQETPLPYQKQQVFINIGFSNLFLLSGNELLNSEEIRDQNLSYFANNQGIRKNVGEYSSLFGWNLGLGFYSPISSINKLMWGSEVTMNLTGSTSNSGFEEAYFYNYFSLNFGLKYYFNSNVYAKLNSGVSSVMTKNRFENEKQEQNFLHQFGIGINGKTSIGYTLELNKDFLKALEFELDYQYSSVRVEVNNYGNDQWEHGSLDFKVGFIF